MSMNQVTDVVIIGGGVIGCSIAYQLAKAGVQVSVMERTECDYWQDDSRFDYHRADTSINSAIWP